MFGLGFRIRGLCVSLYMYVYVCIYIIDVCEAIYLSIYLSFFVSMYLFMYLCFGNLVVLTTVRGGLFCKPSHPFSGLSLNANPYLGFVFWSGTG